MKRFLPALLPLLAAGCMLAKAKDDRPWSEEDVKKIVVGKTTKAEVLQILGPPKQIVRLLESEAFMYVHSIQKETGVYTGLVNMERTDKQYDAVTVIVNREGAVTAVGHRFCAEEASHGLPWSD